MTEIDESFDKIYGEFCIDPKSAAFKIFKNGWEEAVKFERNRQIKVMNNLISYIKEDDDFNQGKLEAFYVAKALIESGVQK